MDYFIALEILEMLGGKVVERDGHRIVIGLDAAVPDTDYTLADLYDEFLASAIEAGPSMIGQIIETEEELEPYELTPEEAQLRLGKIVADLELHPGLVITDQSDTNGAFVILESWSQLGQIHDEYNRRYNYEAWKLWRPVYLRATELYKQDSRFGWEPTGGPFADMRLSKMYLDQGSRRPTYLKPADSRAKPRYQVPEGLTDLDDLCEWGFSDEWDICPECGELIRTQPDHYGWQPEFHIFEDGEMFCADCVRDNYAEDYIAEYVNRNRLLNCDVVDPYQHGWDMIEEVRFESGYHRGQDSDPAAIIKILNAEGVDVLFTGSVGQFDVNFNAWVPEDDVQRAADILVDAEAAGKTDLPYSIAGEMEKALRGLPSQVEVKRYEMVPGEDGPEMKELE
jgi:hypothetical protein